MQRLFKPKSTWLALFVFLPITPSIAANTALFLASPKTGNPIFGANFVIDEGFGAGLFIAE